LLVTSLTALDTYQQTDAWTWEHQALLRARSVAGSPTVRAAFEQLRVHVLTNYVRRGTLLQEVSNMRDRMRAELNKSSVEFFDIKQGVGGLIDIEFLVQYLVLLHAKEHPSLLVYSDNIRQLDALRDAGILTPADTEVLADAYRTYRRRMHQLSLAGEARLAGASEFINERTMVSRLWGQHLNVPAL
jgi:[glutamine synthetase] adenylyltransferase / [glutamine synthetase]-adenylyl-L-tyrosine phosphorylase